MGILPRDTSPEAARVQFEVLRRLTPEQRLHLTCQLSDSVRRLIADGVRDRHPEYDEEQVRLATIRIALGDDLFRKVYPGVQIKV